jgi:hypothetical protein
VPLSDTNKRFKEGYQAELHNTKQAERSARFLYEEEVKPF